MSVVSHVQIKENRYKNNSEKHLANLKYKYKQELTQNKYTSYFGSYFKTIIKREIQDQWKSGELIESQPERCD